MNHIRKILKEETDKRDKLKDLIKGQLTAGGTLNLGKMVKTFGVNHPILEEAVIEWANEGVQRMKNITPKSEAEARFIKMFDGIYADVWFEKYPDSIFFFKGSPTKPEFWFRFINSYFYCSYIRVWSVFSMEYSMEYEDIENIIKPMVEEAFRLRGVTPKSRRACPDHSVEEAFRLRGVTPYRSGPSYYSGRKRLSD